MSRNIKLFTRGILKIFYCFINLHVLQIINIDNFITLYIIRLLYSYIFLKLYKH